MIFSVSQRRSVLKNYTAEEAAEIAEFWVKPIPAYSLSLRFGCLSHDITQRKSRKKVKNRHLSQHKWRKGLKITENRHFIFSLRSRLLSLRLYQLILNNSTIPL